MMIHGRDRGSVARGARPAGATIGPPDWESSIGKNYRLAIVRPRTRIQGEASIANVNRPRETPSPARVDSRRTHEPARVRKQSPPVSRILFSALAGAATIIPLGPASLPGSCHLPAASPSRIAGRLFGVAPRRDCPFHPTRLRLVGHVACAPHPRQFHSAAALPIETLGARCACPQAGRLVSVALILTSRWAGVTCYVALWSPDFPRHRRPGAAIVQRTLQGEV